MKVSRLIVLLMASTCGLLDLALAAAVEPRLHIDFPPRWEYREPVQRDSVLYVHARLQREGATVQRLNVSVIDTRAATRSIDTQSILGLVEKLRDSALRTAAKSDINIVPLATSQGYYFVAADRNHQSASGDVYRQRVEGVMLRSGYLINFTLLTNDSGSTDTAEMISALAGLHID